MRRRAARLWLLALLPLSVAPPSAPPPTKGQLWTGASHPATRRNGSRTSSEVVRAPRRGVHGPPAPPPRPGHRRAQLAAPPPLPAPTCTRPPPFVELHDGSRTFRGSFTMPLQLTVTPSDLRARDRFGGAVALSADGDVALVGSSGRDDVGTDGGAAFVLERSTCTDTFGWAFACYAETSRLLAFTGSTGNLGAAVAMDAAGTLALVGARGDSHEGRAGGAGGVYAFRRRAGDGGGWALLQPRIEMAPGPRTAGALFGDAVALRPDGRLGAAGGYGLGVGGLGDAGGACALEWVAAAGTFRAVALQPRTTLQPRRAGERFGSAVAVVGGTVLVGAPATADSAGRVHVFRRERAGCPHCPHGSWEERSVLRPSDSQAGQAFGVSLALSSYAAGVLAVGADAFSSLTATAGGLLYLFQRQPAYNVTSYTPYIPGGSTTHHLGCGFAAAAAAANSSGAGWAVEAASSGATDAQCRAHCTADWRCAYYSSSPIRVLNGLVIGGVCRLFGACRTPFAQGTWRTHRAHQRYYQEEWHETCQLRPDYQVSFDRYGRRAALSADGQTLAVAAHFGEERVGGVPNSGLTFLFGRQRSGNWVQRKRLRAANGGEVDARFGSSVALNADGTLLAVGAELLDDPTKTAKECSQLASSSGDPCADTGALYMLSTQCPALPMRNSNRDGTARAGRGAGRRPCFATAGMDCEFSCNPGWRGANGTSAPYSYPAADDGAGGTGGGPNPSALRLAPMATVGGFEVSGVGNTSAQPRLRGVWLQRYLGSVYGRTGYTLQQRPPPDGGAPLHLYWRPTAQTGGRRAVEGQWLMSGSTDPDDAAAMRARSPVGMGSSYGSGPPTGAVGWLVRGRYPDGTPGWVVDARLTLREVTLVDEDAPRVYSIRCHANRSFHAMWSTGADQLCQAVPCPPNSFPNGDLPDGSPPYGPNTRCTCEAGFSGSVRWEAARERWAGRCLPSACEPTPIPHSSRANITAAATPPPPGRLGPCTGATFQTCAFQCDTGYRCTAPPYEPCAHVDCGQHGTCRDGVCHCTDFFQGRRCGEAPLDPPAPAPLLAESTDGAEGGGGGGGGNSSGGGGGGGLSSSLSALPPAPPVPVGGPDPREGAVRCAARATVYCDRDGRFQRAACEPVACPEYGRRVTLHCVGEEGERLRGGEGGGGECEEADGRWSAEGEAGCECIANYLPAEERFEIAAIYWDVGAEGWRGICAGEWELAAWRRARLFDLLAVLCLGLLPLLGLALLLRRWRRRVVARRRAEAAARYAEEEAEAERQRIVGLHKVRGRAEAARRAEAAQLGNGAMAPREVEEWWLVRNAETARQAQDKKRVAGQWKTALNRTLWRGAQGRAAGRPAAVMYAWQGGVVGARRGEGSLAEAKLRYGAARWAAMEPEEKQLVLYRMDAQITGYTRPTSTDGWRKPLPSYYALDDDATQPQSALMLTHESLASAFSLGPDDDGGGGGVGAQARSDAEEGAGTPPPMSSASSVGGSSRSSASSDDD